ncbi:MAG TPA: hypothetical protein VFY68_14110 [Nitrososphaeraceae archaeon]|nr:hypothetical protein [Nitrososphaeraceae archaeon]
MALLEETFQELQTDILSYYCLTLVIKIAYKHLRKLNCIGYFLNDLSRCNIGIGPSADPESVDGTVYAGEKNIERNNGKDFDIKDAFNDCQVGMFKD